jgi:hypothetical protein
MSKFSVEKTNITIVSLKSHKGRVSRNEYDSVSTSDGVQYNSTNSTSKTGIKPFTTESRLIRRLKG